MVVIEHIKKGYGKKPVLQDISFSVQCGERIALIGKNGCGKSTLLQILSGIMKPEEGSISFFGKNPLKKQKLFIEFCGYVPQENPLIEELSVKDNMRLWSGGEKQISPRIMEMFQLEEIWNTTVSKLSGGMKRRVSIACAFRNLPPVLLMDEPTSALDLYYKNEIHEWMKQYQKMNGILIMATHDEQEILKSDRCFLMQMGKVKELSGKEKNLDTIEKYILAVEEQCH